MKIKTRREKLEEYNRKYPDRDYNPEQTLQRYFDLRGWGYKKAQAKAKKKLEKILAEREYETIRIIMYEYPMKTDRPRSTNDGHIYSPNASSNHSYYEKAIRKVCDHIKLINTPTEIEIDAYLEMPAQVKPDEVILFESKVLDIQDMPDYDNIGKCYTDIQKLVTLLDDDQVHVGIVRKYYSVLPRVEIRITYLKKHESDYIYKKLKARKTVQAAIATGQLTLEKIQY